MRRLCTFTAVVALSIAPAYAGQHGGGHGQSGQHGPAVQHGGSQTTHGNSQATHGGSQTSGRPTTPPSEHGNPHTARPAATTTSTPTTTTTTTSTSTNPIATKIASHPQLASRLTALLPTGMTLAQASAGFKNQGQFIAALHVSHNLDIPFADLKAAMTGTSKLSLGQAIQKLRPSTDSDTEVKRAEHETDDDVKTTTTTSSTTTSTKTAKTTKSKKTRTDQ